MEIKLTVDVEDIIVMSGLGRSKVHELRRGHKIPGEIENIGRRKLWNRRRVAEWLGGRGNGVEAE